MKLLYVYMYSISVRFPAGSTRTLIHTLAWESSPTSRYKLCARSLNHSYIYITSITSVLCHYELLYRCIPRYTQPGGWISMQQNFGCINMYVSHTGRPHLYGQTALLAPEDLFAPCTAGCYSSAPLVIELDPKNHLITQGWNYTSTQLKFSTLVVASLWPILIFSSLVIITESLSCTFLARNHKSVLAVTTLSQTCGVTTLHKSILYLITVISDHLMEWN